MTTPVPITPPSIQDPVPTAIAAGVQTLLDNAKRLGLTWDLRLGTIIDGSNTSGMSLTIDGDTTTIIKAQSMIGKLATSQRVYVIQIPPSGLFICGFVGYNIYASALGTLAYVSATGDAGPISTGFVPVLSLNKAFTLSSGRGYQVEVGGGALTTSLTTNVMEVRVNWFPGGVNTSMFDAGSFGPEIGSSRQNVYNSNIFIVNNTTTSTDLQVFAKASSGTVTWLGNYSGNNRSPRFVRIVDVGPSYLYSGAVAIA